MRVFRFSPLTPHADEVSAVVVDFGSHTTRAGYAGEDGPRVVTPSFFAYTDVSSEAPASNGAASPPSPSGDGDVVMDGSSEPPKDDANAEAPKASSSKRKYYFGDDGVGVWRAEQEVGSFMVDGMGGLLLGHGPADASRRVPNAYPQ